MGTLEDDMRGLRVKRADSGKSMRGPPRSSISEDFIMVATKNRLGEYFMQGHP